MMIEQIKKYGVTGIFLIIMGINLFLRIYGLDKSPASINFDEAALGYNAYSILMTGKDEYGNFLPLALRSFNDYKPALYAYLSIPFIWALGLNETSTRLVSALAGTASLIFLYLFLGEFVKNKKLLLVIFLLLSLQPWRLHYSRSAFESNLSMAFFGAGSWWLYVYYRKRQSLKSILAAVLCFGLAAYSYHSARLAVPLIMLLTLVDPLGLMKIEGIKKNYKVLIGLVVFGLVCLPIFLVNRDLVLTRFRQENVFTRYFPYAPGELVGDRNVWLNAGHNPIYYFGALITGHFAGYVSPVNLGSRIFHWVKGSPQYIAGYSMLGYMESIVFLIGLFVLLKNTKLFKYRYIGYWLMAGIAPAAVTWNWFHPLRALNIFPAIEIIVALGLVAVVGLAGKYKWGLVVIAVCQILFTINNELVYTVWENHGEYQPGGFKEGMVTLKRLQDNYDQVIIDSPQAQSYIFLMFYQSFPPQEIQKYAKLRPGPGIEGSLNFNFGKYVFRKFDWPSDKNLTKTIFWTSSEVKKDEILATPGADIIQFNSALKYTAASIITKE